MKKLSLRLTQFNFAEMGVDGKNFPILLTGVHYLKDTALSEWNPVRITLRSKGTLFMHINPSESVGTDFDEEAIELVPTKVKTEDSLLPKFSTSLDFTEEDFFSIFFAIGTNVPVKSQSSNTSSLSTTIATNNNEMVTIVQHQIKSLDKKFEIFVSTFDNTYIFGMDSEESRYLWVSYLQSSINNTSIELKRHYFTIIDQFGEFLYILSNTEVSRLLEILNMIDNPQNVILNAIFLILSHVTKDPFLIIKTSLNLEISHNGMLIFSYHYNHYESFFLTSLSYYYYYPIINTF